MDDTRKYSETETKSAQRKLITIAGIGLASVVIALALYAHTFDGGLAPNQEAWAQFGDYFGGAINPFLSFLSLIAILITVNQQNKSLAISKQELRSVNEQHKQTTLIIKKQAISLNQQVFESTFFKMLDYMLNMQPLIYNITNKKRFGILKRKGYVNGTSAIQEIATSFMHKLTNKLQDDGTAFRLGVNVAGEILNSLKNTEEEDVLFNLISKHCDSLFIETLDEELISLLRTQKRIVLFVQNTNLVQNKEFYFDMIFTALSSQELVLLLIYSCTTYGKELRTVVTDQNMLSLIKDRKIYNEYIMLFEALFRHSK